MGKKLTVAAAVVLVVASVQPAAADPIIFSNGRLTGSTATCDSGPNNCGGSGTWIVYDDFSLTADAIVTGFTVSGIITRGGTPEDYVQTSWSIWAMDPFADGATPLASGNSVATIEQRPGDGLLPDSFFTVTGLNVGLNANTTYWLGASHVFVFDPNPATQPGTVRLRAEGNNITGFKQADTAGLRFENPIHDSYFTISGVTDSAPVPEPGSLLLAGSALAGMFRTFRRRSRPRA
jgi:hypothetical protein